MIAQTAAAAAEMQRAMRVMVLGIDYWQFERFKRLTPAIVYFMTGQQERRAPREYAPTADDFGFCREFAVTAAMGSRSTRHEAPAPYRECWCRDSPARPPGRRCPKLGQEDHGVWYAQGEAPATQMAAACASAPSRPSNSSESA